jgi:hypothetical protein
MIIECGPAHDIRTLNIELPQTDRIGVMVSGGIDSTIIYYLLQYLKKKENTNHYIRPLMVPRHEGSTLYAKPMVNHVHQLLGLPESYPTVVGTDEVPEPKQVESGVVAALKYLKIDTVYIGAIYIRPEHLMDWDRPITIETNEIKFPLLHLEKSHVIDLYYKLGIEHILQYTHSCIKNEEVHCGICHGCIERFWGFDQLNIPIMS